MIGKPRGSALPWGMALMAALIGLPMFFEIGVVILVPIVLMVARRTGQPLMLIGIPALAGLSVLHGLVPPHPGPEAAIGSAERRPSGSPALRADRRHTDAGDLRAAVGPCSSPTGPGRGAALSGDRRSAAARRERRPATPSFAGAVAPCCCPVVLMLPRRCRTSCSTRTTSAARKILDVIGDPSVALLVTVVVAHSLLGRPVGLDRAPVCPQRSATRSARSPGSC